VRPLRLELAHLELVAFLRAAANAFSVSSSLGATSSFPSSYAGHEAAERDRRSGQCRTRRLPRYRFRAKADDTVEAARVLHLGCDRALPDQVIERELVTGDLNPAPRAAGGSGRPRDGSPRAPLARFLTLRSVPAGASGM